MKRVATLFAVLFLALCLAAPARAQYGFSSFNSSGFSSSVTNAGVLNGAVPALDPLAGTCLAPQAGFAPAVVPAFGFRAFSPFAGYGFGGYGGFGGFNHFGAFAPYGGFGFRSGFGFRGGFAPFGTVRFGGFGPRFGFAAFGGPRFGFRGGFRGARVRVRIR